MFLFIGIAGCNNPFSPSLDLSEDNGNTTLSDLTTVEGVFTNFKYAYTFKDTTIYGQLIDEKFVFTFRDYEQGFDVSWGRDEDMKTTLGLFQNSQRIDLIWNNILTSTEDSTTANIVRSFNLTITFNPTDIIRIDGRANLTIAKNLETGKWRIIRWVDESNF